MKINKKILYLVAAICFVMTLGLGFEVEAASLKTATTKSADVAVLKMENYKIEEGVITPGGEVTITMDVVNTSTTQDAHNVTLAFSSESLMIYPVYGEDNQVYVGDIAAGQTVSVSKKLAVNKRFNLEVVDLKCDFAYVSNETPITNTIGMAIPSSAGYPLNISSIKVASDANVGGQSLLSITYVNSSNADITDAQIFVNGSVNTESSVIDLGTISAGTTNLQDYPICFTAAGTQKVSLTLKYTDENGEEYTVEEGTYSVEVNGDEVTNMVNSESESPIKYIGYGVALVLGLIVVIVCICYVRKQI